MESEHAEKEQERHDEHEEKTSRSGAHEELQQKEQQQQQQQQQEGEQALAAIFRRTGGDLKSEVLAGRPARVVDRAVEDGRDAAAANISVMHTAVGSTQDTARQVVKASVCGCGAVVGLVDGDGRIQASKKTGIDRWKDSRSGAPGDRNVHARAVSAVGVLGRAASPARIDEVSGGAVLLFARVEA